VSNAVAARANAPLTARLDRSIVNRVRRVLRRPTLNRLQAMGVVTVGRYTYGVPTVRAWTSLDGKTIHGGRVDIGSFTSIGPDVEIFTGGDHRIELVTSSPLRLVMGLPGEPETPAARGDVHIGSDVWIGAGALVLAGVTIGDGAVVGARAVVSRDVRPYEIVTGNPATPVRRRFPDDQIDALLRLRWWDWPDDVIRVARRRAPERRRRRPHRSLRMRRLGQCSTKNERRSGSWSHALCAWRSEAPKRSATGPPACASAWPQGSGSSSASR